ncbi:TPA: PGF-pre-PGF domain-containing protein [Methanosarcina acetivorans]|nr:PGF-pre-PGF domain-containing protein [Methanosarcina acetivorans]HIH95338.1 PGF-pre-PGF domain-containing protein [Methanosarcina acetivorans]
MTVGNAAAGSEQNSAIYEDRIVWQDDSNGSWDIQMYDIYDSTKTQITNNEADQQNPDIYGDRIVWQDSRNGNQDVFMYDISISREVQITTSESYQGKPAIYGDKIVWEDDRNGNRDIYMYDISTSKETRITNNTSDQSSPDIYGDRIVWTEEGAIYMYNISTSTETQVTPHWWGWEGWDEEYHNDFARAPFIYGNRIVYEAETETGNYLIKMYDLSNSTEQTIGLVDEAYYPAIYGDKIVWENIPGGTPLTGDENHDIHMYNLSTFTVTRITTNNSLQGDPAIYGDRIVWTDARNAVSYDDLSDIYMYDLSTSTETRITTAKEEQMAQGTETQITTNEGEQERPAIYGDRIVWTDWRNGNRHDFLNGDIYMYDISTSTETRITSNESSQSRPAIYGDRIVWADYRNDNGSYMISDIYMYDLFSSTETQISTSGSAYSPAIYGDRIVWMDYRNDNGSYTNYDIYMYDLSTHKETQISTSGSAYSPAIYGDRIVWYDSRNGDDYNPNWNIYMYDLFSSKETQISTSGSAYSPAAIYEDRIVWIDTRRTGGKDIYMYDLSTATETRITTSVSASNLAIYDDRIVWDENRRFNGNPEIYMWNLSTSTESKITSNEPYQSVIYVALPAIYGDRIVWDDNRNGNADIYMFTLASAEVPDSGGNDSESPAAEFTSNVSSGNAPLSVLFTDLSQYATGRSWDFNNDGISDSSEIAPVYVFSDPGIYTVKLTVNNANGTDSKTTTITVERKSSGGSSGSGGGGGSPEPAKNVEVKELSQVFITNDKAVKFDFVKNATCVVYVGFDAKKTAGKTTTIVEELKGKSSLVSELPSGDVYKSFNVWVGNSGYATSENIENPVICFKVEKAWLQDKNIDQASIALNRYSDEKWEQLPANLSGEDDTYMYFTAGVPGFSPFAITGESKSSREENETGTKLESEGRSINGNETGSEGMESEQQTEQEESTGMPGFEVAFSVACLLTVFLYKRR